MTQPNQGTDNDEDDESIGRRAMLTGIVGLGAAGLFSAGRVSAQSDPQNDIGTAENPYLTAYVDRINFVPRTSDPSNPDEGTIVYRSDL